MVFMACQALLCQDAPGSRVQDTLLRHSSGEHPTHITGATETTSLAYSAHSLSRAQCNYLEGHFHSPLTPVTLLQGLNGMTREHAL